MSAWKSELFCTAFNKEQIPPESLPEVVFLGRSNVGKSTLINALLAKKLAKVSSKPGKTRSINFYSVTDDSCSFYLVDLPGYGYAARSADERRSWWRLINDYFAMRTKISFAVHLVDFRHGPLANDAELTKWLDSREMVRLVVFTKADKISPGKRKAQYNAFVRTGIDSVLPPFMTCGVNDISMQKLRDGIIRVIQEMTRLDEAETH